MKSRLNFKSSVSKPVLLPLYICFLFIFSAASGQNFDVNLLKQINPDTYTRGAQIAHFESGITHPISFGLPIGLLAEAYLDKSEKREENSIGIFGSVATADVLVIVLKNAIQRPRPYVTWPADVHPWGPGLSYSMPSGHTAESFALATSLSIAYPHWYIIIPSYAWAASVACSRMVVGVHYPTDVLAGAIEGSVVAIGIHYLGKWYFKKHPLTF
jgi:undecaprenyl-diphosphatase